MIIYPETCLRSIHFDELINELSTFCRTIYGKREIHKLIWFKSKFEIEEAFKPISECIEIIKNGQDLPLLECEDVDQVLEYLKLPGWIVDVQGLANIKKMLQCISRLKAFSKSLSEKSILKQYIQILQWESKILYRINQIIDDQCSIYDTASDRLNKLRIEQARIEKEIQQLIHNLLKSYKKQNVITEDVSITIRNGRMVVPVPVAMKGRINGIIHDQSATGLTIYIEPFEVVELGNALRDNQLQQQNEIRKILLEISDLLRNHYDSICFYPSFIGQIDVIFAKANFAHRYNCVVPKLSDDAIIEWKKARHLVLEKHLSKTQREIVPLDLLLNSQNRVMILSGANAGGKTVVLKTLALLQCMIQNAIPVSFSEDSIAGIFHYLFVDIGDNQSIESDLSTFSSHLQIVRKMLENANERTLFLFDEIGSATDPELGSALAKAILLNLLEKKSIGIVTTHFESLKNFASENKGMLNGSMTYDYQTLQPLYKLQQGIPGQSFTFEIAKRLQIPDVLLDEARRIVGHKRLQVDALIGQLEAKEREIKEREQKLIATQKLMDEIIDKYKNRLEILEKNYQSIIKDAKERARHLLTETNKVIENTIRVIKESGAQREQTRQVRNQFKDYSTLIQNKSESHYLLEKLHVPISGGTSGKPNFKPGDMVYLNNKTTIGQIIELTDFGRAKVLVNSVIVDILCDELIPCELTNDKEKKNISKYLLQKKANFSQQIDIRGMRADEATIAVEKFIDDALVAGVTQIYILHGKGYGILRRVVRQILSKNQYVIKYEDASIEQGGEGVTIVYLKLIE